MRSGGSLKSFRWFDQMAIVSSVKADAATLRRSPQRLHCFGMKRPWAVQSTVRSTSMPSHSAPSLGVAREGIRPTDLQHVVCVAPSL
jgi:hypothetical protein